MSIKTDLSVLPAAGTKSLLARKKEDLTNGVYSDNFDKAGSMSERKKSSARSERNLLSRSGEAITKKTRSTDRYPTSMELPTTFGKRSSVKLPEVVNK